MLTTETCGSAAVPAVAAERPVTRCPRCRLVQYRTAQNRCRKCYLPLVVLVAAPPPQPEAPQRPNVAGGVKGWRRLRGLTQKQLAVASHLPRTYISRIENGRITPGLVTLERVAMALHVTLPSLLTPVTNGASNGSNGPATNGNNGAANGHAGYGTAAVCSAYGDACLREVLRYSGLLTGAQRLLILARVRELVQPRVSM